MSKITYTDKTNSSPPSGLTTEMPAADLNEIKDVVNANDDAATLFVEAWSTSIRADKMRTHTTPFTMSGDLTLTWDATGAVTGMMETKMITGDGSNIIIDAPIFPDNGKTFPTEVDKEYLFVFVWQETYLWVDVNPEITATGSIILMQDDFAGTTIDTGKWTVVDSVDDVTISQDDALLFTCTGAAVISWTGNYLQSNSTLVPNDLFCGAIDFVGDTSGDAKDRGIAFKSVAGNTHIGIRTRYVGPNWQTSMYVVDSAGTSLQGVGDNLLDFDLTGKTVRARLESGTVYMEYWNVSTWTSLDSIAIANVDSDLNLEVRCGDATLDDAGVVTFDRVRITNADYSTQYPS